jgi:hypothetical protein
VAWTRTLRPCTLEVLLFSGTLSVLDAHPIAYPADLTRVGSAAETRDQGAVGRVCSGDAARGGVGRARSGDVAGDKQAV